VPSVRKPSRASLPCCCAVSLSTGAPGTDAFPPSMCCDCQMKSCRRSPWFLERRRCCACFTTSLKSAIKACPSGESFFDGLERAFDLMKLFRAISICSLEGTLPAENAVAIP